MMFKEIITVTLSGETVIISFLLPEEPGGVKMSM